MNARRHFFIVGAQRCGTSFLYELMAQHPDIEMAFPRKPEPKFFLQDDLYDKGISYYESTYFNTNSHALLFGEKSTSYLESPRAAERIARHFPDASIVVLLRDPIERAYSHYRFSCDNGAETMPFEQAIRMEAERATTYDRSRYSVSPYAYLQRGRYVDYLPVYEALFPLDQIHVLQTERIVSYTEEYHFLLQRLDLGTDYISLPLERKVNASTIRPIEINSESLKFMVEYFRESSHALQSKYDIDLALWPSVST